MSHELRTPLNSLLILAEQLSDNPQGNLDRAGRVRADDPRLGRDLLALINDILDLSKIESGTVTVDVGDVLLRRRGPLDRSFRHMATQGPAVPRSSWTEGRRAASAPTPSGCSRC
jgi:signal transduction histidine kinase